MSDRYARAYAKLFRLVPDDHQDSFREVLAWMSLDRLRQDHPSLIPAECQLLCGDGWYHPARTFLDDVAAIVSHGGSFRLLSATEIIGDLGLHYETHGLTDLQKLEIERRAIFATSRARETCEVCGDGGVVRKGPVGFLKILCDLHAHCIGLGTWEGWR